MDKEILEVIEVMRWVSERDETPARIKGIACNVLMKVENELHASDTEVTR